MGKLAWVKFYVRANFIRVNALAKEIFFAERDGTIPTPVLLYRKSFFYYEVTNCDRCSNVRRDEFTF